MEHTTDAIDRAAMALGGGLITLGVVVLGVVEILAGEPYGAAPVERTNGAGEVVNTIYPAIDPVFRTGLVIAGLLVLLAWGGYKMATTTPKAEETGRQVETVAD